MTDESEIASLRSELTALRAERDDLKEALEAIQTVYGVDYRPAHVVILRLIKIAEEALT